MIMRGEGRRATNLQTVFTETIVDVSLLLIDENLQRERERNRKICSDNEENQILTS
jgi:hypothetical protein